MSGRRGRLGDGAPLAATLVSLAAFFFCVMASTAYHWHSVITGPLTVASAVALFASVIWLNRGASGGDEEDEDPE